MAEINEDATSQNTRVEEGQRTAKVAISDATRSQSPRADVSPLPDPPMEDLPAPMTAVQPTPPPPPEADS